METLANLCTGIEIENRINIDIKLIQYGHKKPNVNIPLSVLVEYCLNNGCTPFSELSEVTKIPSQQSY